MLKQIKHKNVLFVCDNSQIFMFVSDCFPVSFHDMNCIGSCVNNIGYQGLVDHDINCMTV